MLSKRIVISLILILIIVLSAGENYRRRDFTNNDNLPRFSLGNIKKFAPEEKREEAVATNFPEVETEAQAVIVYDIEKSKIIYSKNSDRPLPLASITKLMTILVAREHLTKSTQVSINPAAVAVGGGTRLQAGSIFSFSEIADLTLVGSLNEGAAAIAAATSRLAGNRNFVDLMNDRAAKIGMKDTHFINETGLDLGKDYGGSYGSALDVAKLMAYIIKNEPEMVEATTADRKIANIGDKTLLIANTNEAVNRLPGLLASKTGYTHIADGNLVIVIDAGVRQPVAIVVLGSSKTGRFSDIEKLTTATYTYLRTK